MTKSCVVCKKYPVSGDNTRSFHKFPFDEDIKKQWMEITGVTKITINCTVCSDHFTPQSYHQTDGFGSVKRLLSNAIPIVGEDQIDEVEETNVDEIENIMLEESKRESSKTTRQCVRRSTRLSTANENRTTNTLDNFDDQSCSNDSSTNSSNDKMDVDKMSRKLKRKLSTTNIRALDIKRMFRFRDGTETKFICREEFVTEDAWNKFLRLMLLNRRRMEGLRQRICRRKKMIDSGQCEKTKEDPDPEKFLEVVLKE
ncbi:uncharacterized protein [Epargyreus clarus]|uniref:uncharacterized protein n=1 Tax=Epargyreus clarus TaxID=520877 RepID=UPI003C2E299C